MSKGRISWAERYVASGDPSIIPVLKNGQVMVRWSRNNRGRRIAIVRCFCGSVRATQWWTAINSHSCGCITKDILRAVRTTHGHSKTRAYSSWGSMWDRCVLESHKSYKDYGGRGIGVCDQWKDFSVFLADMGKRPNGAQLSRIDNDKDYTPDNCRWETPSQNSNNRRSNHFLEFNGERRTITEWSRIIDGLPLNAIFKRIQAGWSTHDALTKPVKPDCRRKVSP